MDQTIQIVDVPARRILAKRTTCPHNGIGSAFGQAIHAVGRCLRASGGEMTSPPLAIYTAWREADCDLAVGCEVDGDMNLIEECEWIDMPACKAAMKEHLGDYAKLGETHEVLMNWIEAEGKQFGGPCFEMYMNDPGAEPDLSKWRTDVYYPVR
jgi:effector-binding domain-containing protein